MRPKWRHRAEALAQVFVDWGCEGGCVFGGLQWDEEQGCTVSACEKPEGETCIDYICRCADQFTIDKQRQR